MIYEEVEAPESAKLDIDRYWMFRLGEDGPPHMDHLIVPDGAISLCATQDRGGAVRAAVMGPSDRAHVVTVEQGVIYVGVRLHPAGGLMLPGLAPTEIAGRVVAGESLDRGLANWLPTALNGLFDRSTQDVDAAFQDWPFGRRTVDLPIWRAADRIRQKHGTVRIQDIMTPGLGERQFRRRFVRAVGLSAKSYAWARRLRRACVLAIEANARMAAVAAETGFVDQAHLSHEVTASFGVLPSEVAAYLRRIRHKFAGHDPGLR